MSLQRMIQWLLLAVTAALLMFLKWLHLGVTHYNIFLLILIGLLIVFRTLSADQRIKD